MNTTTITPGQQRRIYGLAMRVAGARAMMEAAGAEAAVLANQQADLAAKLEYEQRGLEMLPVSSRGMASKESYAKMEAEIKDRIAGLNQRIEALHSQQFASHRQNGAEHGALLAQEPLVIELAKRVGIDENTLLFPNGRARVRL